MKPGYSFSCLFLCALKRKKKNGDGEYFWHLHFVLVFHAFNLPLLDWGSLLTPYTWATSGCFIDGSLLVNVMALCRILVYAMSYISSQMNYKKWTVLLYLVSNAHSVQQVASSNQKICSFFLAEKDGTEVAQTVMPWKWSENVILDFLSQELLQIVLDVQ